jgi:hypothetical protein
VSKFSLTTLKSLVKKVFDSEKQWVSKLVSVPDMHGREAIMITHSEISALMMTYMIFIGRFVEPYELIIFIK